MTKKTILYLSLFGSGVYFLIFYLVRKYGCDEGAFFFCRDAFFWSIYILQIFPIILLFSLITYKMQDQVSWLWIRLTYIWVPLSIFIILIMPEYSNSFLPIFERSFASSLMLTLFFFISIILITYKHFSLKKSI
jgi:hypothetical protein